MRAMGPRSLELSDGKSIKLIGVDRMGGNHPANQRARRQATEFLDKLCSAKTLQLEYGETKQDTDGQTQAYVFLLDGEMVNAELIKAGYARVRTSPPFEHLDEFLAYEREARAAGRGLWAQESAAAEPAVRSDP